MNDEKISKEDAELLAEVDFLVEAYAASDEPMTPAAEEFAATVRHYVRRWAKICGYIGDGTERHDTP